MWKLQPRSDQARLIVTALYIGAIILFFYLQEMGLKLRRAEQRAWWAGTGRDLLNAAGFGAVTSTLYLAGFPAPAAMLVGGSLTLVLFGAYVFMATQTGSARPRSWALLLGLAVSLPVLLWPGEVLSAAAALARLFPDPSAHP